MIVEFFDLPGQRLHDRFQDWRREHQTQRNACFLAFHGKNNAFLHAVDCWHIGGIDWDGHRVKGNKKWFFSLTKNRKVCADSLDKLLFWATQEGVSVNRCSHCCEALSGASRASYDPPTNTALNKSDGSIPSVAAFEITAQEKPLAMPLSTPEGNHNPRITVVGTPQFQRDTKLKNGFCNRQTENVGVVKNRRLSMELMDCPILRCIISGIWPMAALILLLTLLPCAPIATGSYITVLMPKPWRIDCMNESPGWYESNPYGMA